MSRNTSDEKEHNCSQCPHLDTVLDRDLPFLGYGCGLRNGAVVSHGSKQDRDRKGWEITFFRVPEECPRSDDEVVKRASIAPIKTHRTTYVRIP